MTNTSSELPLYHDQPVTLTENLYDYRHIIGHSRVYRACTHQSRDMNGEIATREDDDWLTMKKVHDEESSLEEFARLHPQAFFELVKQGVDCLHGTTTLNLPNILEHGLVPTHLFKTLGITALGKESHTQPLLRDKIHVVPIGRAAETVRYAEGRLEEAATDYVNTSNYERFLSYNDIDTTGMYPGIASHFKNHGQEAASIEKLIESGQLVKGEGMPLVIGIDSGAIDADTEVAYQDSVVKGDVGIYQRLSYEQIRIFYVPHDAIEDTQSILSAYGHGAVIVRDIATIR